MDVFKSYRTIMAAAFAAFFSISCQEIEIPTYSMEDSAVCFAVTSSSFSMKGVTQEWVDVEVPVTFMGPVASYDRDFKVCVVDAEGCNAVEGVDFRITGHTIEADALNGSLSLQLKKFTGDVTSMRTVIAIEANESFQLGYPAYCKVIVQWSEEYVRPEEGVWRYWYTYFCHGYSRAFHQFVVETLGPEVELYTGAASYVKNNPDLTMKMPTWWYEASRTIYQAVREHDDANPGNPLRHSADYEGYTSYKTAVGEGVKPESVPTILETLETL